jgi:hypothetical protein
VHPLALRGSKELDLTELDLGGRGQVLFLVFFSEVGTATTTVGDIGIVGHIAPGSVGPRFYIGGITEECDEEGSFEWYATGLGLGRADVYVSWSNIASASNIQVLRLPILTGDWFLTDQIDVDRGRFRISRERDSALRYQQCI